jgi:hypothetical protein
MKGLKSTIALAVVLAGLGAYIYFVTWKQPAGADAAKKTDKVFDVAADKIDEVTLTTASGEAVTAKKANATSWTLTAPAEAPADQAEIGALTNALATADVVRVVDENPSNLNDYGLSNPRIAVSFKASGDKDYRHLFIGEKTPTGGDLFAKRDDKKVFLIASFQENSLNKSAFDLRDKSVLKVDRDKIDSVDLMSGPQNVTLAKDGSEWKVTKPEPVRADYGTVEGLIGKLETVKMKSIATTEASPADLKKYGLDKPQATVNLNAGSSKATLLIGNKTDDNNLYARDASKPMIVTIDGAILDDIKKAPDDYRRKDLFEFRAYNANRVEITRNGQSYVFERVKSTDEKTPDKWKRTSPNPGDVDKDKFDAFLAKLANMRVSTFQSSTANTGTDKPAMTVSVKFDDNKKEEKVTFGQSGSDVFAIRPNEPGAAKTDAADFNESVKTLEELGK